MSLFVLKICRCLKFVFVSQSVSSVAQLCPTLCDPMNHSTPGLLVLLEQLQSSLRLTSIKSLMPSSHLILCGPLLLLPQIPPASETFSMSQLYAWGGQSSGVSALASFLRKKSQGWSSEWTGRISFPNLLVSPVILQLLPPNGQGLVLWLLVFEFHHMTCSGCKNEGRMAVCHSWASASLARFHVPCWASATVMRTSLGQLLPIQPELRTEHTWSRVTQLTDRSEAKSKVAQVNVQINGYFKHWVLGQFGMQYYGGDIKLIQ